MPWLGLGETRYRKPTSPLLMSRGTAALALATRAPALAEAAARRERAARMLAALPAEVKAIGSLPGAVPGCLRLPVLAPARAAGRVAARLGRGGVGPAYPGLLPDLPAVRAAAAAGGSWPGAATLVEQLLTLPSHSLLTAPEADALMAGITAALA
jgi:dTDP-4-amino-4,6-dideoxygalactose transaminase